MLLILPVDVKEGRSSTMVSASSSWTYKKALKKRKLTASQMYVFHNIIRTSHSFDKFPHLNILRAAHFWSNTTCKLFLRTVPVFFNKPFIGSNLHLNFHRTATLQLRRVTFERRGIWICKEHMPSFRRENNTQHYTHTGLLDSFLSSWFIYIKLTVIQRSADGLCCPVQTEFGLGKHSSFFSNA